MATIDASETRTTIVPNTIGAQLIKCHVSVEENPPDVSSFIEMFPIVAFSIDEDHTCTPILASGEFVAWGELRAAVFGCYVYGIVSNLGDGVSTADKNYTSVAEFEDAAKGIAADKISNVREQKGLPEEMWPRYRSIKASDS